VTEVSSFYRTKQISFLPEPQNGNRSDFRSNVLTNHLEIRKTHKICDPVIRNFNFLPPFPIQLCQIFERLVCYLNAMVFPCILMTRQHCIVSFFYVGLKNTAFWDAFTVVSITYAFWNFAPCGCGENRRFGDHHPFSGFLRVKGHHRYVTMESLLITLSIGGYYLR
jgi:hypothetical protein